MKSYKDLENYRASYELAIKVHKVSLKLPQYEKYEEGTRIRKSSKGIVSCIAEGYGRRRYKAEFIKFLIYSQASCDETIIHLNFIRDTHPDFKNEMNGFIKDYEEVGKKINRFIAYVDKEWNRRQYFDHDSQ